MELESVWFYIWGFLWIMYFVTDGFVLGIGALFPLVAKTNEERRILLNTVGPVWDGNEVWLITAGAITFGAFPLVYAVMFTSLYTALMLLLFCLIVRGVSFEFRSKISSTTWRGIWDSCVFISSLLASILLGVAFANIFQGVPLSETHALQGSFFTLINIYGLLGGFLFLVLFVQHGLSWLCIKTTGNLHERSRVFALKFWPVTLVCIAVFLLATAFFTDLFVNYTDQWLLFIIPAISTVALIGNRIFIKKAMYFRAWFASAITIAGTALFGLVGLFPRLLPSTIDSLYSLTIDNSASEPLSLRIMLFIVCIFIPLILIYQGYAYNLFKHPVTADDLKSEEAY